MEQPEALLAEPKEITANLGCGAGQLVSWFKFTIQQIVLKVNAGFNSQFVSLNKRIDQIMSALDDVKTAFTNLTAEVTEEGTAITAATAELSDLASKVAALASSNNDAALEDLAGQLNGVATNLKTRATGILASVTSAKTTAGETAAAPAAEGEEKEAKPHAHATHSHGHAHHKKE